jgi:flavoprotein
LLEKVFDKKEMTLKRKWCIFGNSHFVINDASISIKVKKAISKDDIYQQLLNNKLFGIKKMYLVCPLQNKIFLLDYEENKVKEIKSE